MSVQLKAGDFICRAMQVDDLAAVFRIQAEVYIDEIQETYEVIHARFQQVPDTSWVVERAGEVCGYLVGYQSVLGEVTPWGSEFAHKQQSSALYLHDLAISKSAAGCGLGPMLVSHALAEARQRELRDIALVSVQNSKSFWQKLGFNECAQLDEAQKNNLASYSGPAIYMTRELVS
jgi:ribosomal protein S18 acetylase RimI-like enzyme